MCWVDVFGRPDVAVGDITFSDTTGERSSEILVVNLLLFKNRTLLMTDIWDLSFSVYFFPSARKYISFLSVVFLTPICHTSQTLLHLLTKILIVCPGSQLTSGSNLSFSPNLNGCACTKLLHSVHWPRLLDWLCWEQRAFGSSCFPDFQFLNFFCLRAPYLPPVCQNLLAYMAWSGLKPAFHTALFHSCRIWILSSDRKYSDGGRGV